MWGLLLPTYFIAFFHRTSLSPIADELAVAFGLHEGVGAALGTLASTYFIVYTVLQIPSGLIADTIGARLTVSIGSALMGLGTIWFAWAPSLGVASAARFLVGFGAAFNFIALLRQQVNWFDKRFFPLLTALTVVTGNVGALFGIGPFALLARVVGWRQALVIPGVAALVFAVVIALFVRNRPAGAVPERGFGLWDRLRTVLSIRTNYLTFVSFGLTSGLQLTFGGFWGVPFLMHVHGLDKLQASGCTTMLMLGVAIGCVATPLLVRFWGGARRAGLFMFSCGLVMWGVVFFAPLPVRAPLLLNTVFVALGFFVSGFILPYTTVRESNPEHVMGMALAFTNTGGFGAIAVLQVVVGFVLDRFSAASTGNGMPVYPAQAYHAAFALLIALQAIAIVAYAMVREPKR